MDEEDEDGGSVGAILAPAEEEVTTSGLVGDDRRVSTGDPETAVVALEEWRGLSLREIDDYV